MLVIGAILLAIAAMLLFWFSARQQKSAGLPAGRVIYSDTSGWGKVEKPLYDSRLALTGKPDYLVSRAGFVIPVEAKSRLAPPSPYDSHIMQLAAYCLLVERVHAKRPPYGILRYHNRSFSIDYTPALEARLLDLLAEMRQQERRQEVNRSHQDPARCARCGYRELCDQSLAG